MELRQRGLQVTPFTVTKVMQLYETKNSRHSSMLVGKTGSAKSVTWRTLQSALTALHHKGVPGFQLVQVGVNGLEYNLLANTAAFKRNVLGSHFEWCIPDSQI